MARRGRPSGMGTQYGEPVKRAPVDTSYCRGCNVLVSAETVEFRDGPTAMERGCFCTACGIDDPVGIGRERPFDQAHGTDAAVSFSSVDVPDGAQATTDEAQTHPEPDQVSEGTEAGPVALEIR